MSYLSSPETRSRAARLDRVLNDLLARTPEVEAAAVMSFDGLPMASAMPPALDEDRVAAMSAALLSLGERATQGLGRGALDQIYIEGEHGTVFLVSARDEAVLMAVSSAGSKVGMMRYEVRQAADQVGEVLASVDSAADLAFDAGYDAAFDRSFAESFEPSSDGSLGQPEVPIEAPFGQPHVPFEVPFGQSDVPFEPAFNQADEPFDESFDEAPEPSFASSEPTGDHPFGAHLLDESVHAMPSYGVASVPAEIASTVEVLAVEPLDDAGDVTSQSAGHLPPGGIPFWA